MSRKCSSNSRATVIPKPKLWLKLRAEHASVDTAPDRVSSIVPTIVMSMVATIGTNSEMASAAAALASKGDGFVSCDPL